METFIRLICIVMASTVAEELPPSTNQLLGDSSASSMTTNKRKKAGAKDELAAPLPVAKKTKNSSKEEEETPLVVATSSQNAVNQQVKKWTNEPFALWISTNFPAPGFLRPVGMMIARSEEEATVLLDQELKRKKQKEYREQAYRLTKYPLSRSIFLNFTDSSKKMVSMSGDMEEDEDDEEALKNPAIFYSTDYNVKFGMYAAAVIVCENDHAKANDLFDEHLALSKHEVHDSKTNPYTLRQLRTDAPSVVVLSWGGLPSKFQPENYD